MKRATPRVREFLADAWTPLAVARRLGERSPHRFLFESVTGGEQVSRYSFLGAEPAEIYRLHRTRLERIRGGVVESLPGAPMAALRSTLEGWQSAPIAGLPFSGGFVGTFGFDWVRLLERLPESEACDLGEPLAVFGRFDDVVVFDHARQRLLLVGNAIAGESDDREVDRRLDRWEELLGGIGSARATRLPSAALAAPSAFDASPDGPEFRAAVERALEAIAAGEIFQVVLARRFAARTSASPESLYRALRVVNPSPYMVLLELPGAVLVGASPEMLVRVAGSRVLTRPIAGTRRRGRTEAEDQRLAAELLGDPKERAEHVMLVDLGRNDVGRVAVAGSVEVTSFLEVERYSHVMHLVSSVEGELAAGATALDALIACFPAGTVSGAPKIRAMEILSALEPEPRGFYSGATGYLSFTGDLDTCITIRTLVVGDGEVSVTAGAGIVADSTPAAEERETESKAAALLAAVALAERLEAER